MEDKNIEDRKARLQKALAATQAAHSSLSKAGAMARETLNDKKLDRTIEQLGTFINNETVKENDVDEDTMQVSVKGTKENGSVVKRL